jgi:hypothetical protein
MGIKLGRNALFTMYCKEMLFLGWMHFHMVLGIV